MAKLTANVSLRVRGSQTKSIPLFFSLLGLGLGGKDEEEAHSLDENLFRTKRGGKRPITLSYSSVYL